MNRVIDITAKVLKWVLIGLVVILLLLALIIGLLLAALRSDTGTAWVLEQIPGLTTEQAHGSLLGEWQAASLHWHGYGVQVTVDEPEVEWSPTCLFQKTVCLDRLQAASIDVVRTPDNTTSDESSGPVQLQEVRLPVNLDIGMVDLGPFHFNGTLVWDRLTLEGGGGGADFHIRELALDREDVSLRMNGRLATRGDWPLALDLGLTLPPPTGDQWRIAGQLGGSVRDLRARLTSEGYLNARLQAALAPLDPVFPARVELQSGAFHALDTLPETLELQDWQLNARGNLSSGYQINTSATLPGNQGPVTLRLSGRATAEEARDLQLTLSGPSAVDETQAELAVTGGVRWAEALVADVDITMGAFAWYSLLPDLTPPPVTITSLQAEGEYRAGQYTAVLDLDASGPMGEATVDTRAEGDLQQVRLQELTMTTGGGRLQGEALVGFAGPSWDADLVLDQFDPGYWIPGATASINGSVTSRGALDGEGQPEFSAEWALHGQWREEPLTSRGQILAEDRRWQIPEIMAGIGDNRLALNGELQDPLGDAPFIDLEGALDVPRPESLYPGLAGSLQAEVAARGPMLAPAGTLEASGEGLLWQDDLSIDEFTLSARLANDHMLDAALVVNRIQVADQIIEQVEADVSGVLDDHRLDLRVRHEQLVLGIALAGGWLTDNGGQWLGQLADGSLLLTQQDQKWQLENPADLRWQDQTLTLGAHCWRWQDSTLCAGDQTLVPDVALDLTINNLPTSALAPLLPETVRWSAHIDGSLLLATAPEGPTGQIRISAGPGRVHVVLDEDWEALSYGTLTLSADLTPALAEIALRLDGDGLGALSVDLAVDPNAPERPARGSFSLSDFDLAMVGSLLNMEEVTGQVEGAGRLEGPLLAPDVDGELLLSNGRVVDPMVPIPISDLNLRLAFAGKRATLDGSWQSNGTGEGEIGGVLDWDGTPVLTMVLTGDQLPLTYEPYAKLKVSPDLELRFTEGDLTISGRVEVPSGEIHVRELPEQAVSVSSDEVIVGREPEPPPLRSMSMDVTVVVGEDRVTFEGFGVTGELEGELRIGNNMDTRGALQLVEGRYEAFGQELDLRRARLVFVGPVGEPYLDIEAVRRVDNVVAGIRLSGPAQEPRTEVFSEPPMSQDQALSYVILGRPLQSQGDQGQVSRAALSLGLNRASGLTRGIGEAFGIRDLTLEAEGSGDESSVVASGYLTEDLSLRYGVGLFEPITTVALRYDLGRYFYVEAASGLASSLDIFYTRDF